MIDQNLVSLLLVVSDQANFNSLVKKGISYIEIATLTENAIKEGYLSYVDKKIKLSDSGIQYLKDHHEILKKRSKDEWISKDIKSQIKKINKNTIFVPDQNKLSF